MKYDIIVPALIAFGVSVILSPIIIPFLKKLKFGQFVRDDGPESHLKKSGTPTMGGLIILFSIVITSLFYIKDHKEIVPILFATLGFGLVGFLDDFIKVVMKRTSCMAEDVGTVFGNRCFCILHSCIYGSWNYDDYSIYT